MSRIVCEDGDQFCRAALAAVLRDGTHASPRGKGVRELTVPTVITLLNPARPLMTTVERKANYRFGMAEACWIASGADDLEPLEDRNKRMREFSDDRRTLWGAYGPRVMGQLPHVIGSLKRDPDSRQAVLMTWRPQVGPVYSGGQPGYKREFRAAGLVDVGESGPEWRECSWRSKDTPCTVAWHFQLRNNRLNLTVFMRSNDAWLGTTYDVLSFTTVQRCVAAILGVEVGEYHHVPSNLHLYDEHIESAERVLVASPDRESPLLPAFEFTGLEHMRTEMSRALRLGDTTDPGAEAYAAVIHRHLGPIDASAR